VGAPACVIDWAADYTRTYPQITPIRADSVFSPDQSAQIGKYASFFPSSVKRHRPDFVGFLAG
jgi:hypothetical protein